MRPLENILVLDFSTLLPGPFASLVLAEAGATVVKIERATGGDEMRSYTPKLGDDSVNFAMLNRGKESIAIDLKSAEAVSRMMPLISKADILIEQFRPGVMDRLGFGYPAVRKINPRLIYCSITGWGQDGPKSSEAGHDLNYMAETGILGLARAGDGAPALPPILAADIAGGSYPALINILLALRQRDRSGEGAYLDIAMGENLFSFAYWGLGNGFGAGNWPKPGNELVTGGTARYQIYRTADQYFLAAAPLEDKFWNNFCHLIDLPHALREADAAQQEVIAAVAKAIVRKTAEEWEAVFTGHDVCCSIVRSLEDATNDAHFKVRNVFAHRLLAGDKTIPALPVPIVAAFRGAAEAQSAPHLGENLDILAPSRGEA
jgi:crotonobetainyl-CoA:carnitine CoA-transferase CaiB-like acyl-CoA transferase